MATENSNAKPPTTPAAQAGSSRVTVVCAECKRLKLKCDRRNPCGACVKRDAVARCLYSPAAAEKIDVQSLHNRVLQLEGHIIQLTSGKLKCEGEVADDHTLLATGASGSSVVINLDDVASVWLDSLEIKDADLRVVDVETQINLKGADRPFGDIFPSLGAYLSHKTGGDRPAVTSELLELLPPPTMRDPVLRQLEFTMSMHPSFNMPTFRSRIETLFTQDLTENPPTLSFFALTAAGFALGAQAWLELNHVPEGERGNHVLNSDSLWALSKQSLAMFELSSYQYDLDFVFATLLQCLYLLHDGKPRIAHTLYPTLGKLVNVARIMGLHMDPDEHNKHSLFDAEMRRRAWWEVYYCDLFISDFLGQDPSIHDAAYTCQMPADVDDVRFNPSSSVLPSPKDHSNFTYFILKCKLAQLVKSMKKRTFREPGSPEPSLDATTAFETEVQTWLSELPPAFRYKPQGGADLLNSPHALIAQRCELVTIANVLILKLFMPFCKRNAPASRNHASESCTNAAHIILSASYTMLSVYKHSRPAAFVFYSFVRQVFMAAVVIAKVVIHTPQSMYASVAMTDLRLAIEVLKDPLVSTSRGPVSGGVEGSPSEALRIVQLLYNKAEACMSDDSAATGSKRKHAEVDEHIPVGLQIPFVSGTIVYLPEETPAPPVAASGAPPPAQSRSRHILGMRPSSDAQPAWVMPSACPPDPPKRTAPIREGKRNYPAVGIRVRPPKEPAQQLQQQQAQQMQSRPSSSRGTPSASDTSTPAPPPPPPPNAHRPPPHPPSATPSALKQPAMPMPPPPPPPQIFAQLSPRQAPQRPTTATGRSMSALPERTSTPMYEDMSSYVSDQVMGAPSPASVSAASPAASRYRDPATSFSLPSQTLYGPTGYASTLGTSNSMGLAYYSYNPSNLAMMSNISMGSSTVSSSSSSNPPATVDPHVLQQQTPQHSQISMPSPGHPQAPHPQYSMPLSSADVGGAAAAEVKTDADVIGGVTHLAGPESAYVSGNMQQRSRAASQSFDPESNPARPYEQRWGNSFPPF